MTGLPARTLGINDRGRIRPSVRADLVLFDPETITDRSTYQNPHQYPEGIHAVVVNGQVVVENNEHTGAQPGVILRHRAR